MCYDSTARPPEPPGERGAATGRDLVINCLDNNQYNAYLAEPAGPFTSQVLIYPDIRGLHQFYKDLALRFAEVGIRALALDYFGRTAGLTDRGEEFEWQPHVEQMNFEHFMLDVDAALKLLRADSNAPIFITGFCIGGTLVYVSGTQELGGVAGLIPFYSGVKRKFGEGTILETAHTVKYPLLGLYGGDDPGIPIEAIQTLDAELDKAGVEHKLVVYENAPHSFFDRKQVEFAQASANAWERVLNFIHAHSQNA